MATARQSRNRTARSVLDCGCPLPLSRALHLQKRRGTAAVQDASRVPANFTFPFRPIVRYVIGAEHGICGQHIAD
jgi:hypothetical protein